MSSTELFKENLESGCRFEREVVEPYLIDEYPAHWIVSYHDNRVEKNAGPRIKNKLERPLILPDFGVIPIDEDGPKMMFEAKYKTSAFSLVGHFGQLFVAIEEFKCLQYEESSRIMGFELYYIIGCEQTDGLYMYDADQFMPYAFSNNHGKGPVRAFKIDDRYKIGTLK